MGDACAREYCGGGGAERDECPYVTAGSDCSPDARAPSLRVDALWGVSLICLVLDSDAVGIFALPAGCALAGSVGGRMGDSGS
jgi:hypothetical protein